MNFRPKNKSMKNKDRCTAYMGSYDIIIAKGNYYMRICPLCGQALKFKAVPTEWAHGRLYHDEIIAKGNYYMPREIAGGGIERHGKKKYAPGRKFIDIFTFASARGYFISERIF